MKLKSVCFASLVLIPCLLIGCQPRKNKDSEVKAEAGKGGADVNDVSILFPLPKAPDEIKNMFPLNFVNNAGQSPISPELFQSVIKHHDYEVEVEGKKTRRVSGATFTGKDRNIRGNGKADFGPYDLINDWKIVAMRFDPCAPLPTHNLLGHGPREVRSSFDPQKCLLQLRLTAQPVMPKERESQRFPGPVMASDYAMHLLFNLDQAQAKALYGDLLKFKESCGDLTSSMPLMVHPCLVKESNEKTINGPHHTEVQRLIKVYAKQLVALAMLATHDGDDPWTFMNGRIEAGKFVHLPISAVHKEDPKTVTRGKNGNILEPFFNGFYQGLNFQSISQSDGRSAPSDILALSNRVAPLPIAGKVNVSLLEEYNFTVSNPDFNRDGPKEQLANIIQKLTALDNPLRNDFFSTDCVSCHASANIGNEIRTGAIGFGYVFDETPYKDKSALRGKYLLEPVSSGRPSSEKFAELMARGSAAEMFPNQGPYTHAPDPFSRANRTINGHPVFLLQFAYLGNQPLVSQRAINESVLVAKMANSFFGEGRQPIVRCDQAKFAACLQSPYTEDFWETEAHTITSCLIKVCPERARDMKAVFGDKFVKAYRVKKAFNAAGAIYLDNKIPPANILDFPVGTVIFGEFGEADSDRIVSFKPAFAQEFKTVGGEKLLIEERMKIAKDAAWEDLFEEIDPTAAP